MYAAKINEAAGHYGSKVCRCRGLSPCVVLPRELEDITYASWVFDIIRGFVWRVLVEPIFPVTFVPARISEVFLGNGEEQLIDALRRVGD